MHAIKKVTRRTVTLIEMMIVIFLIGTIIGVLAYNYRGSLEEGKKWRTEQGAAKVRDILEIETAKRPETLDTLSTNWKDVLKASPLVQNPDTMAKDGWGSDYRVEVDRTEGAAKIKVESDTYKARYGELP